jgi:hypothetical protein
MGGGGRSRPVNGGVAAMAGDDLEEGGRRLAEERRPHRGGRGPISDALNVEEGGEAVGFFGWVLRG